MSKTATGLRKTVNTRVTMGNDDGDSKPPEGSTITQKSVSTSTEEIENGYLITKSVDGRYKTKGSTDSNYFHYNQKWYSKTDPLTIKVDDKSLADAFDDNK